MLEDENIKENVDLGFTDSFIQVYTEYTINI